MKSAIPNVKLTHPRMKKLPCLRPCTLDAIRLHHARDKTCRLPNVITSGPSLNYSGERQIDAAHLSSPSPSPPPPVSLSPRAAPLTMLCGFHGVGAAGLPLFRSTAAELFRDDHAHHTDLQSQTRRLGLSMSPDEWKVYECKYLRVGHVLDVGHCRAREIGRVLIRPEFSV